MIKLNVTYTINNGQESIVFKEGKRNTITGEYNDGTLTGAMEGDVLKATFHNKKTNGAGLIEFTFHENGFNAKWKQGMEPGPMRGKWEGKIDSSLDFIVSIPDEIKVLLKEYLIQPEVGIDEVYNWFFGYFKNQFFRDEKLSNLKLLKNELTESFKEIKSKNIRTIGIDFPILLSKGKNRPILMICAMDPLREESDDITNTDEIGYWVPFSVINSLDSKHNRPSDRSNLSFFHTILETHDIYVTDIFKVFYREGQIISNTQHDYKKISVHKLIFDNEIKIIKPDAILTLGNDARDAVCQILDLNPPKWSDKIHITKSKENINVIMVPHISGSARGTKAPILNNERYKDIEGTDNLKYAKIIISEIESKH